MRNMKKTELELYVDKYNLREFLKLNHKRYSSFFGDLYAVLQRDLKVSNVSENNMISILYEILDEDPILLQFIRKQKPLPPTEHLNAIVLSVASLVYELSNSKGEIIS